MRVPSTKDHVVLTDLEWNTEYEVLVVAENQQGKSQPGSVSFRTSSEPSTTPGELPFLRLPPSIHPSLCSHTLTQHMNV